MSENYATNRIVTKSYLQNCERAAGPLQGGGELNTYTTADFVLTLYYL